MTLYDFKWGAFDPQSQIRHFAFHYFLKKSRNKENYTKSSQNSCQMHKFIKFCYLMKWTNLKTDKLTIDIYKLAAPPSLYAEG